MNSVVLYGSKAHLLGYVRSLRYGHGSGIKSKYPMGNLARDSRDLRNLRNLTLFNIRIEHISEDLFHTCFSAFRETLTHLTLNTFAASFSSFVTFVCYFPLITTLQLHSFTLEPDEGPVPSLSRPLRGKFHVSYNQTDGLEFFNRFTELDLEYEELVISSPHLFLETKFLENALRTSTNTVKHLWLTGELQGGQPPSALIKTICSSAPLTSKPEPR